MSDDKEDSEGKEKEFVFDDIKNPDFSKYDGLKSFKFEESSEKLEHHKYNELKGFEFSKSSQYSSKHRNYNGLKGYESEKGELLNEDDEIISNESPIFIVKEMSSLNINITNFQEEVMGNIKKLVKSFECKIEQKKVILLKSEKILNEHISRAKNGEITISKNANPQTNAATIIYAVLVSSSIFPKVSGAKLSKMVGASSSMVGIIYNKYYKVLAPKEKFSFKGAQIGESRKTLSLYFFEVLINNN